MSVEGERVLSRISIKLSKARSLSALAFSFRRTKYSLRVAGGGTAMQVVTTFSDAL